MKKITKPKKTININFFEISSVKKLMTSFFGNPPKDKVFIFQDTDAVDKKMTIDQIIKTVKKLGCWGYCKTINNHQKEIYYWIGKKTCINMVTTLIAHEFCHALGSNSERSAMNSAQIASLTLEYLLREKYVKVCKK